MIPTSLSVIVLHASIVLLVSLGHAFVIGPSEQQYRTDRQPVAHSTILFASNNNNNNKEATTLVEDPAAANDSCGEGFYQSDDGAYCIFDYDTAAQAFGTADEAQMVNDADRYWKELEAQNAGRKKFGLAPLTPEQYVALQGQIRQMQTEQQEKLIRVQEEVAAAAKAEADRMEEERSSPFAPLKNFMNAFMEDTCEANYDCERPEVCCDFGFKKMCCSSGQMTRSLQQEYAMVPVPMGID